MTFFIVKRSSKIVKPYFARIFSPKVCHRVVTSGKRSARMNFTSSLGRCQAHEEKIILEKQKAGS
jgi:hypothetical protein